MIALPDRFVAAYCEYCSVLFVSVSPFEDGKHFCRIGIYVDLKPFPVVGVIDLQEICVYRNESE